MSFLLKKDINNISMNDFTHLTQNLEGIPASKQKIIVLLELDRLQFTSNNIGNRLDLMIQIHNLIL